MLSFLHVFLSCNCPFIGYPFLCSGRRVEKVPLGEECASKGVCWYALLASIYRRSYRTGIFHLYVFSFEFFCQFLIFTALHFRSHLPVILLPLVGLMMMMIIIFCFSFSLVKICDEWVTTSWYYIDCTLIQLVNAISPVKKYSWQTMMGKFDNNFCFFHCFPLAFLIDF